MHINLLSDKNVDNRSAIGKVGEKSSAVAHFVGRCVTELFTNQKTFEHGQN